MPKQELTLDIARANGSIRYFTGKPCKNGHIAERITANKTCVVCRVKTAAAAQKRRAAKLREWFVANKEVLLQKQKARHQKNPSLRRASNKAWAERNPEANRATKKQWYLENYGAVKASHALRRAKKEQAIPAWANKKAIESIYAEAVRQRRDLGLDVHVDHVIPLRSEIVCGLHCESNLEIIPAVENMKKSNRYWPDMPTETINNG